MLDVGKTHAKLSLWTEEGTCLARRSRPSAVTRAPGYAALDMTALEDWLAQGLRAFGRMARVEAIVPTAHGAAGGFVDGARLILPPPDYEDGPSLDERAAYAAQRDPFAHTGSPLLSGGLNLGLQLHRLEKRGPLPPGARLVTWPQVWAWRLCGVAATEVSSLGCHTDLWRPAAGAPSALAERRGWAARFAPVRRAEETLGPLLPEWRERCGLPEDCRVLCGAHDSNLALLAARARPELRAPGAAALSTGTWFVALRLDGAGEGLPEGRDLLVNVDPSGRPVPSARFMGGREAEMLAGAEGEGGDRLARAEALVQEGAMALPTFAPGAGPFPDRIGEWVRRPADASGRRAAAELYLALMADTALRLLGADGPVLVEGRFARADLFVRALASLRDAAPVLVADGENGVALGALRLLWPDRPPPPPAARERPLPFPLDGYARNWRAAAER